ncbi:MAG: hypothetical protein U1E65_20395 [Myxococcota bacterium]
MRIRPTLLGLCLALSACTNALRIPDVSVRTIGPEGGELRSLDGRLRLSIPAGALSQPTEMTIEAVPPEPGALLSFAVEPKGLILAVPAELSLQLAGLEWSGQLSFSSAGLLLSAVHGAPGLLSMSLDKLSLSNVSVVVSSRTVDCAQAACGVACGACDASEPACAAGPPAFCAGAVCTIAEALPVPLLSPESSVMACPAEGAGLPIGEGASFWIDDAEIAREGLGFALQERCRQSGCVDNRLFGLADYNLDIRGVLRQFRSISLIELGAALPKFDDRGTLAVRAYLGQEDRSYPYGSDNVPEFKVAASSVRDETPLYRGSVRWQRGRLVGALPALPFALPRALGRVVLIEGVELDLRYLPEQGHFEGLIGGVLRPGQLVDAPNPYCGANLDLPRADCGVADETLLEAALRAQEPDVDLDGDGLERLELDGQGHVLRCRDGDGTLVAPVTADVPKSCASNPKMADGFSISIAIHASPSRITGVAL